MATHASKGGASVFGTLGELAGEGLQNAGAVGRIVGGLKTAVDAVREIAVQKTEQERIRHSMQTDTEYIHTACDVLLQYLERSFDERRANFDTLFTRLDTAMAQGSPDGVERTLDAVVKLAQSSPVRVLVNVAKAKEALQDKNREWEF
jgi:NADPH-dependent glutamate synthase beta subunit-like oxidoreductase